MDKGGGFYDFKNQPSTGKLQGQCGERDEAKENGGELRERDINSFGRGHGGKYRHVTWVYMNVHSGPCTLLYRGTPRMWEIPPGERCERGGPAWTDEGGRYPVRSSYLPVGAY